MSAIRSAKLIECYRLHALKKYENSTASSALHRDIMTTHSKKKAQPEKKSSKNPTDVGVGGETHQTSEEKETTLTTNQGNPISDNQNSLRAGSRGPTLLEDLVLREKITHFDHERIPERIVHARGSGAHGIFRPYKGMTELTRASFLSDPKKETEVFVRFSTVAGGAGSADLPRDVRGFAVKFYTDEGNFDLVGNNIPVFFIQDAMKFPDLIHSVKMEPDRGFPQAASAHDTFWDFATVMPESMHMLMWAMSDRAIPRSLRMIEGFGIHTFRLVNAKGESRFVKFHWRPLLGASSVIWDEAVKINGADPDFHRRDLWEAIESGDFPEFEFSVQIFDQETADGLEFDILDPTKLIPEEIIPLTPLGKMVLNRNPDNFFAETEQVAFHPGHIVPGIDFTNDPLLQGRLHSYLDTQLSRLGGPNFHEIPIHRPRCPMQNFQRDGIHRMEVAKGRISYEPNSLGPNTPRENPIAGFSSFPQHEDLENAGEKVRQRSETFSDHYSQARMFWRSMSEPEQRHIVGAFTFELGKVETLAIRKRMLGHLDIIDSELGSRVAKGLGMEGEAEKLTPVKEPLDLMPSPSLSMVKKAKPTFQGRKLGILVSEDCDPSFVKSLVDGVKKAGGKADIIAPKVGGVTPSEKSPLAARHALPGAPSVLFDSVALVLSSSGAAELEKEAAAIDWIRDAFGHLKFIAYTPEAAPLLKRAGIAIDDAVIEIGSADDVAVFLAAITQLKKWEREDSLRSLGR